MKCINHIIGDRLICPAACSGEPGVEGSMGCAPLVAGKAREREAESRRRTLEGGTPNGSPSKVESGCLKGGDGGPI